MGLYLNLLESTNEDKAGCDYDECEPRSEGVIEVECVNIWNAAFFTVPTVVVVGGAGEEVCGYGEYQR